jgi:hypothetical protein
MTNFIDTYRPLPPLSVADKIYIGRNFYRLEELCLGRPTRSKVVRLKSAEDSSHYRRMR